MKKMKTELIIIPRRRRMSVWNPRSKKATKKDLAAAINMMIKRNWFPCRNPMTP